MALVSLIGLLAASFLSAADPPPFNEGLRNGVPTFVPAQTLGQKLAAAVNDEAGLRAWKKIYGPGIQNFCYGAVYYALSKAGLLKGDLSDAAGQDKAFQFTAYAKNNTDLQQKFTAFDLSQGNPVPLGTIVLWSRRSLDCGIPGFDQDAGHVEIVTDTGSPDGAFTAKSDRKHPARNYAEVAAWSTKKNKLGEPCVTAFAPQ